MIALLHPAVPWVLWAVCFGYLAFGAWRNRDAKFKTWREGTEIKRENQRKRQQLKERSKR